MLPAVLHGMASDLGDLLGAKDIACWREVGALADAVSVAS